MILSHMALSCANLREFAKTPVILTPGAVTVGCEPQFVPQPAGDNSEIIPR